MKFVGGNVPAELKERLEALAKRNDRSVSAEFRLAIRQHVERGERDAA